MADTVRKTLEDNLSELYREEITEGYNSNDYLPLFQHIRENQLFYRTYFKLGYDTQLANRHFDNRFIEYHCEFFKSGITAVIKMWLANGCRKTAKEINQVLISEYDSRG